MRLRHPDGTVVHLAYCTNVHPTEDLEALLDQVRRFGGGVRERLGVERLGLGLWLPAPVAAHLAEHSDLERLRSALAGNGLEVVTLNAFPYAGFHDAEVKKAVYRPDWCESARLTYTLNCASVLARLLPDDAVRGSISTLPLGWRSSWYADRQRQAEEHLARLAEGLEKVEADTGRQIRVGMEPEPGCIVETTTDAAERLSAVDTERIGVCLDACHLAVEFEDPVGAVRRLADAGLPVVKTQASAALHAASPADAATRDALRGYAEDRFLHQTREHSVERGGEDPGATQQVGRTTGRDDLPEALDGKRALRGHGPWRVHFHVPLHEPPAAPLEGTHHHLEQTLGVLFGGLNAVTDHVEVETYTWSVLPEGRRPDGADGLMDGLAAELSWARDRMTDLGLEVL